MNGTHLAVVGEPSGAHDLLPTTEDTPVRATPRLTPVPDLAPDVLDDERVADALLLESGMRRVGDPDEAWPPARDDFSPWLYRNVDVLADALGFGLKRVTADVEVEGFRFDLRAEHLEDDTVVLVTTQLDGADLAVLGECLGAVSTLGAPVVVWLTRQLRDDVRHTFDWLNERDDNPIRFYGIEVDVAVVGDTGPRVPWLDVIARPGGRVDTGYRRARARGAGESAENRARQDLFRDVLRGVHTCRPGVQLPPRNIDCSWVDLADGPFGAWSLSQVDGGRLRVEARLDTGDPARTEALYDLLVAQRDAWSRAAGLDLEFDRREGRRECRIAVHHPSVDLLTMTTDERDCLVVWAVRTFVALHDTLDVTLRGRAQLLHDASTRGSRGR
ncbi:hypothetical protein [Oryzobacter terrae]|uniref:hypothetical protein n=1 Tax=Oryzobacter terrae TaxID=1620385 RepID=UPI00366A6433